MKHITVIIVLMLVFLLGLSIFFSKNLTNAQTSSIPECQEKNLDSSQCIDYLKNKVSEKQGQAKTLSSQIAIMDNQIKLTEARIYATKQEISSLVLDIDITTKKIASLQEALNTLSEILLNRIVATYEAGMVKPFEILLSSRNASSYFSRLNYLEIAQSHDKRLIYDTQATKNDYTNQKKIFEDKKKKVENLKAQLEAYTSQLDLEKKSKQNLLVVTKNDESKYQQLVILAQAERAVVFGGGVDSYLRDVNQGDAIGSIASHSVSPGCSSGAHLHFEAQKDGSVQNPNSYLRSVGFSYDYKEDQYGYYGTINPSGDLPWPLNEPIVIHQGYGSHGYAQSFYVGGIHTGIDIDSSSSTVKAVKGGKFYGGSYNCANGKLYYAKVIHDGGLTTWYLHMIPN